MIEPIPFSDNLFFHLLSGFGEVTVHHNIAFDDDLKITGITGITASMEVFGAKRKTLKEYIVINMINNRNLKV